MCTVEDLRKQGYKVRVAHFRRYRTGEQIPLSQYMYQLSFNKSEEELSKMTEEEFQDYTQLLEEYNGEKEMLLGSPLMQDNFMVDKYEYLVQGDAKRRGIENKLMPRGGITEVTINKGTTEGSAITHRSVCCNQDIFNRKLALRIALGRVEKYLTK